MAIRRLCFLLCLTHVLPAQQNIPPKEVTFRASNWAPRAQYTLKAETRLVEVGVVVRDSRNHSIGGLTREDFIVEEGGKRRDITAFTAETATQPSAALARTSLPSAPALTPASPSTSTPPARFLGLLFDDVSMGPGELIPARKAAKEFLTHGVSPGDLVAIFLITKGQILPFTSDITKLNDALDHLNVATRNPALTTCPNLTPMTPTSSPITRTKLSSPSRLPKPCSAASVRAITSATTAPAPRPSYPSPAAPGRKSSTTS